MQDPAQVGCSVDVGRMGGGAGRRNGAVRSTAGGVGDRSSFSGLGVGGGVSRSLVGILRVELESLELGMKVSLVGLELDALGFWHSRFCQLFGTGFARFLTTKRQEERK